MQASWPGLAPQSIFFEERLRKNDGMRGSTPRMTRLLFPVRFVGAPALALELPRERIDRLLVVALVAFLLGAGRLGQVEFRAGRLVGRGCGWISDPQHHAVGGAGLVR